MGLLSMLVSLLLVTQACQASPPEHSGSDMAGEDYTSLLQLTLVSSSDGQSGFRAPGELALAVVRPRGPMPDTLATALMLPEPKSYLGYRETGGIECGLNHSEDLYKPIPQVLREHPGVDGFCYFEFHAPWMAYHGRTTDYVAGGHAAVLGMRANPVMCPSFPGEGKGPLTPQHYVGVNLVSHVDCMHQMGDDIYCHALGWLKNQRLDASIMENATAWEALAEEECSRMMRTYNFTEEEVTVGKHLDDQGYIWSGPRATARNLNLHAYHKCALGTQHAADEMAYCMTLSCLLPPGNVIGHGPWCE